MPRLIVLMTNLVLSGRTGTEVVIRDLARGLQRRGHKPIVYSSYLGEMAHELESYTIPVVDDLANVAVTPDVIHGHHTLETAAAVLHFPNTPAVYVCHDWASWHDRPPRLPRVRRYVAVDYTCRDRLVCRHGIAEAAVNVIQNAVDLERFSPRAPLPSRPRRAVLSGH